MRPTITFLVALALASCSSAPSTSEPAQADLAGAWLAEAELVFEGTVLSAPEGGGPATVKVERVHRGGELEGNEGALLDVQLTDPADPRPGALAIFFAHPSRPVAGGGQVVREIGHLRADPRSAERLASLIDGAARRELRERCAEAGLVIAGEVLGRRSVRLVPHSGPPTTPDPAWLGALVRVDTVVKGAASVGDEVLVVFPSSFIGRWAAVPKPLTGQRGVWILRKSQLREMPEPVWMAPESDDCLEPDELERVLRAAAD